MHLPHNCYNNIIYFKPYPEQPCTCMHYGLVPMGVIYHVYISLQISRVLSGLLITLYGVYASLKHMFGEGQWKM